MKARKRMLNRQSKLNYKVYNILKFCILGTLRTRNNSDNKFVELSSKIQNLEGKSSKLELENLQLKSDKEALQKQVESLMAIVNQMKAESHNIGPNKRMKTCENEDPFTNFSFADSFMITNHIAEASKDKQIEKIDSGSELDYKSEDSSSDLNSSSEEDVGILKTESWIQQNDLLAKISKSRHKQSTVHSHDYKTIDNQDQIEDAHKFFLQRDTDNSLMNSVFGETIGEVFSHGSMLMLNIVMCLILCFCATDGLNSEGTQVRDHRAHIPGMRAPLTYNYLEIKSYQKFYIFGILILLFLSVA